MKTALERVHLQRRCVLAAIACAALSASGNAGSQQAPAARTPGVPTTSTLSGAPLTVTRRALQAPTESVVLPQVANPSRPTVPVTAESAEATSSDGGLKIHGHWVIEVKRTDGTLKDRREFENSYTGGPMMGLILSGIMVPDDPAIVLQSAANGVGSLCNNPASANTCVIVSSTVLGIGGLYTHKAFCGSPGACYTGLTYTPTPAFPADPTSWVISAIIKTAKAGTFDMVGTALSGCRQSTYNQSTLSPYQCYVELVSDYAASNGNNLPSVFHSDLYPFTSTQLPTGPVTVALGETIVISVTISFM